MSCDHFFSSFIQSISYRLFSEMSLKTLFPNLFCDSLSWVPCLEFLSLYLNIFASSFLQGVSISCYAQHSPLPAVVKMSALADVRHLKLNCRELMTDWKRFATRRTRRRWKVSATVDIDEEGNLSVAPTQQMKITYSTYMLQPQRTTPRDS